VDHPLSFFIMEERFGTIVFLGRVTDPSNSK
jgi:serine protease inhibitor